MTSSADIAKWRLRLALAALFLSSMCTMGDLVISPIAADVYRSFADAPLWLVNLGVTGPALVGLPFGLLAGYLCDRVDKKIIMVAGFALFTVSSTFGIAFDSVIYFVGMRLLATGVGWGLTNTAALSILSDLFTDETEHGVYVGRYNAAMSVIGSLLAFAAGHLALGGWTCAYQTYVVSIPVLVMLVVFLPSFPPTSHLAARVEEVHGASTSSAAAIARGLFVSDEGSAVPRGWWRRLVPLTVQVFFVATLYFVMLYLIALYVEDAGIGDEALAGTLTSVMTIATALGSLVFGRIYARMRSFVCLPAIVVIGAMFLVLAIFPSMPTASAAFAIAGFMWPFFFCFFYTRCTEIVPREKQSTATSIVAAANGLAAASCSHVLTGAMMLTGKTCLSVYPVFGAGLWVIAALTAVYLVMQRKRAS